MVGDVRKRAAVFVGSWLVWAAGVTVFLVLPFVWPPLVLVWLAPFAWWIWENGIRR